MVSVPDLAPGTTHLPAQSTPIEDKETEQLCKALRIFKGGTGASTDLEWPAFHAVLFQLLLYTNYSPGVHGFITNGSNLDQSRRVRTLLMCKLQGPALQPFLHDDSYRDKGFEMIAKLIDTYSPSSNEDIYSNFVGLLNHSQGPTDTLDFFTSELRRYAICLESGGITLDPRILAMVFMNGLSDRYSSLKHDFCLHASRWSTYSLEALQQEVRQYSLKVKNMMDVDPSGAHASSVAAHASCAAYALCVAHASCAAYAPLRRAQVIIKRAQVILRRAQVILIQPNQSY